MKIRAYAQLIRLPNLPSALADICLAAMVLVAHAPSMAQLGSFPIFRFILLLLTSGSLYCAGMVWNDYFDLEQDKKERPQRPIPSERVSLREAAVLGSALFLFGLICAWFAGTVSFILSCALVGAILLYDSWLKRTPIGPVGMGLCRALNVLLGLSLLGSVTAQWHYHLAVVVGVYVGGVTWLAKTEAKTSESADLQGAGVIILVSFLFAIPLPMYREISGKPSLFTGSFLFPYLLVLLGFYLGIPVIKAILSPTPTVVQSAVRRCLMGLIILDAILATAMAGSVGLLILLLIIPSIILRRQKWLYAT